MTKGRGFAGVVKRHKFVAGHASHGPTHGKQPGSIGASAYPSRVVKGKRLPGRMGGVFLTLPVGPAEALVSDVVVAQLRGRAATVRSIVRTASNGGAPLVGVLSTAIGLRMAIVSIIPLYAVGGVIMFFAARHYPKDIAFVVAETKRIRRR